VILFDLGDVLTLADTQRTPEVFTLRFGISRLLSECYFDRPDYMALARGQVDWDSYCQRLREEWGVGISNDEICEAHAAHVYALDTGVTDLIRDILTKPVPPEVGGATNTVHPQWTRNITLGVEDHLSRVWRSDTQGALKGDEGVFARIVTDWIPCEFRIVVAPEEVLIVDDSQANCAAAREAGLVAFQYTPCKPWPLEEFLRGCGVL